MTYGQRAAQVKSRINEVQRQLNDLDSDYKTINQCKAILASASVVLNDINLQCEDTQKAYDRKTIEARYDQNKITFKSKSLVFDYLDTIVNSTKLFGGSINETKTEVDAYGEKLDSACKSIASEALDLNDQLVNLRVQLNLLSAHDPDVEIGGGYGE